MKTYFSPSLNAVTGLSMNPAMLTDGFADESLFYGVSNLDAPQVIPLGGVRVLVESDKYVTAIDFISTVRSS